MLALHERFYADLTKVYPHVLSVFIEYVEYMKNYFAYVQVRAHVPQSVMCCLPYAALAGY